MAAPGLDLAIGLSEVGAFVERLAPSPGPMR
jgi:hypothetical protein